MKHKNLTVLCGQLHPNQLKFDAKWYFRFHEWLARNGFRNLNASETSFSHFKIYSFQLQVKSLSHSQMPQHFKLFNQLIICFQEFIIHLCVAGAHLSPSVWTRKWAVKARVWSWKRRMLIPGLLMFLGTFKNCDDHIIIAVFHRRLLYYCTLFWLRFKTDLLEINSHEPTLHLLFIPGNPGI